MNQSTHIPGLPQAVIEALHRPSGARFYKCALQVNPYEYVKRHPKGETFADEDTYNAAVVDALLDHGVEVIAITDHYRVKSGLRLAVAAEQRGLHVFRGFEACTKDGVHILCLFDPSADVDKIDRFIGECGIHDDSEDSPAGTKDCDELMTACTRRWGGIPVAAHVSSAGGLLATLRGQTAIKAWRHEHLHACCLPGPVAQAPENHRPIIQNRNADYMRERPIAVVNAQDVSSPAQAAAPGACCYIKMASVSVEGLKQAFLDPVSRIRLVSDDEPEDHSELLAIAWEGGFLDGIGIRFNDNLNVMIGGRGTGKSTIIESVRFVLDIAPLGDEAGKLHKSFVSQVLGAGTKVSLLLRSHTPSPREYLIERTVGNRPTVKDSSGELTELSTGDVSVGIEIFGQHEISELARSPERLTGLLDRFVDATPGDVGKRSELRHRLGDTRTEIAGIETQLKRIDEELAALPGLRETLQRYKDLGLEEKLKDKKQLVTEEGVLKSVDSIIDDAQEMRDAFGDEYAPDISRLDEDSLKELGGAEVLRKAKPHIEKFKTETAVALAALDGAIAKARAGLQDVRTEWDGRSALVEEAHQKTLRELARDGIDGSEYTSVLQRIEQLEPKKTRQTKLEGDLKDANKKRRKALEEWEDTKSAQFRALERAAKKVSRKLGDRVQVSVTATGDRAALEEHLRTLGGRVSDMVNALNKKQPLSVRALAQACREGKEAIIHAFPMPPAQAEKLAGASSSFIMELEEIDLPATTTVQLNVAREGAPAVWRKLDELSTGQKATAVLLLLLLESPGPLLIDQPEDDLDNRFITDGIVPQIKQEKRRRQFVFATHNANIPVLGDAELIAALEPAESSDGPDVQLPDRNLGSIDSDHVRELVGETLEGGKTAFEMRRLKYGF